MNPPKNLKRKARDTEEDLENYRIPKKFHYQTAIAPALLIVTPNSMDVDMKEHVIVNNQTYTKCTLPEVHTMKFETPRRDLIPLALPRLYILDSLGEEQRRILYNYIRNLSNSTVKKQGLLMDSATIDKEALQVKPVEEEDDFRIKIEEITEEEENQESQEKTVEQEDLMDIN